MIGIIDYGMGNLRSVEKAVQHVGHDARILRTADQVGDVDKLILPGVGAFSDGMDRLRDHHWDDAISDFIASGKPFLGICLGMQLLFDSSEESAFGQTGVVAGLGVLKGEVRAFTQPTDQPAIKIPHMGWNAIDLVRPDMPLFADLPGEPSVYFVHGYFVAPADESTISATCEYGGRFCAAAWRDNVWAAQFHPEKSQRVGLKMIENFASL